MSIMFKASVCKTVEQDKFEQGCLPETFQDHGEVYKFSSSDLELVRSRVASFLCHDLESGEIYEDRLEISLLEDGNGSEANEVQRKAWEQDRLDLYAASYSITLERVTSETLEPKLLKEGA